MKTLSRKAMQRESILRHGLNLIEVFKLPPFPETYPSEICKAVHRIEVKMHRTAEQYCNGEIDQAQVDKAEQNALKRLDAILNYKAQNIPVFINLDPRGYALKIESDYTQNISIHRDMGGYGIISPEF